MHQNQDHHLKIVVLLSVATATEIDAVELKQSAMLLHVGVGIFSKKIDIILLMSTHHIFRSVLVQVVLLQSTKIHAAITLQSIKSKQVEVAAVIGSTLHLSILVVVLFVFLLSFL